MKKQLHEKKKILFICTHNSARSQMAEGMINHYHGDCYVAQSAGTIATRVNLYAIRALQELGIDISHHRSKAIEEFRGKRFDIVVTVCDHAKQTCPFFPGKKVMHKSFCDPSNAQGSEEEILAVFRTVRDEIRKWLEEELA